MPRSAPHGRVVRTASAIDAAGEKSSRSQAIRARTTIEHARERFARLKSP
jgi:hypothetical protein